MSRALPKVFLGLGLALAGSSAVAGDHGPVLLELYTSQGCSSCPPADAMIAELARRDEVLPLALHVDYWDYIGWVDDFASPVYTQRQKSYARAVGSRTIFTPQIVIGGTDHVVGLKPMQVERLIQKHAAETSPITLSVTPGAEGVAIAAEADAGSAPGAMLVQLVRFDPHESVAIHHGENAGMVVEYTNIVRDWQVLAAWDGSRPFAAVVEVEGPAAVIVQKTGPGEILAVARID